MDETSLKLTTGRGEKEYEMDAVFDFQSTQEQVYECVYENLICVFVRMYVCVCGCMCV